MSSAPAFQLHTCRSALRCLTPTVLMASASEQARKRQRLRRKKNVTDQALDLWTVQRLPLLMKCLLICFHLHTLLLPASARLLGVTHLGEDPRHHSSTEQQQHGIPFHSPPYQGNRVHSLLEGYSAESSRSVFSDLYSNITGANSSTPFFSTWVSAFNDTRNSSAVCSADGVPLVEGVECEGPAVVAIDISGLNADLFTIPTSLGLLTSLTSLRLSSNSVGIGRVTLPSSLGNLTGLKELDVSNMGLYGQLPSSFRGLTRLTCLKVDQNYLSGTIPEYMSSFQALVNLEMQLNRFSGPLPDFILRLNGLTKLYVYSNYLTGRLPSELGQAKWMVQFKAQWNFFNCSLPESYGNFINATHIDLRKTGVFGEIPSSWGNLKSLEYLHLEDNFLTGSIPPSFGKLTSLHEIYLTNNSLTGDMPACWASFKELDTIRVEGVGCPSGQGETCCGGAPQLDQRFCAATHCGETYCNVCYYDTGSKAWSLGAIVGVVVGGLVAVGLAALLLLRHWQPQLFQRQVSSESAMKPSTSHASAKPTSANTWPSYWSWGRQRLEVWERHIDYAFRRYSLVEILQATENFSMDRVIGKGAFGVVYMGKGPRGETWAVKRARAVERKFKSSKSSAFEEEVKVVHKLRHKNLVQLLGYCNEGMEQVLVYEYVALGALSKHLYGEHDEPLLDLEQRLQVAVDTAEGLKYLHNFTVPPLVHRDIKPDNVLLDADLSAKVADFGLAKGIEDTKNSVFTRVAGTRGYLDPEYVACEKVTFRCDVYSFGVVLLELITGRHAIMRDPKDEENCVHVTSLALPMIKRGDIHLIADARIMSEDNMRTLLALASIAVDCIQVPGRKRPTMDDVCMRLEKVQREHMAHKGLATAHGGDPENMLELQRDPKDPLMC